MSTCALGNHFDIHGGGADLQFPHHENEIAQSEGATGEPFVNLWMHNGFVRINEEKMSKSLGNFFTVREILERYRPEEVRYFILTSQYRSPLNYDDESLQGARAALTRLYTGLRGLPPVSSRRGRGLSGALPRAPWTMTSTPRLPWRSSSTWCGRSTACAPRTRPRRRAWVRSWAPGTVLGILQADPEAYLQGGAAVDGLSDGDIEDLIRQRREARQARQWAEADRIRDALTQAGVILEDGAGGTTWRRG